MSTTKAATKTSWKKAAVHEGVTLPSGTVVSIKLPNLSLMLKTGQLPNTLIEAAVQQQNAIESGGSGITAEMIENQWDFYSFLVSKTVVEPEISQEEVAEIPAEDIEMLVEFATRQRDMDAVYRHLSGLDTQESFRRFRGIAAGLANLDSL